jgi:hypothetical protein
MYCFVNSTATIFLYSADIPLAAVEAYLSKGRGIAYDRYKLLTGSYFPRFIRSALNSQ